MIFACNHFFKELIQFEKKTDWVQVSKDEKMNIWGRPFSLFVCQELLTVNPKHLVIVQNPPHFQGFVLISNRITRFSCFHCVIFLATLLDE